MAPIGMWELAYPDCETVEGLLSQVDAVIRLFDGEKGLKQIKAVEVARLDFYVSQDRDGSTVELSLSAEIVTRLAAAGVGIGMTLI